MIKDVYFLNVKVKRKIRKFGSSARDDEMFIGLLSSPAKTFLREQKRNFK